MLFDVIEALQDMPLSRDTRYVSDVNTNQIDILTQFFQRVKQTSWISLPAITTSDWKASASVSPSTLPLKSILLVYEHGQFESLFAMIEHLLYHHHINSSLIASQDSSFAIYRRLHELLPELYSFVSLMADKLEHTVNSVKLIQLALNHFTRMLSFVKANGHSLRQRNYLASSNTAFEDAQRIQQTMQSLHALVLSSYSTIVSHFCLCPPFFPLN